MILYYIILYYITLYYIILYYIILYYIILYYIILYITTILFPIEWTMWKPWFDDWHLTVTEKPWCLFRISFSVGSNPATQIYLGTWWDWLQLVGVWPTPLKNMSQLGWWLFPNIWKNNPNVPNQQPAPISPNKILRSAWSTGHAGIFFWFVSRRILVFLRFP